MSRRTKNILRVSIRGMKGRERRALKRLFRASFKDLAQFARRRCDAVLIDMDTNRSDAIFLSEREKFPDRPIIVLSENVLRTSDAIFVQKPIDPDKMLWALDSVRAALNDSPLQSAQIESNTSATQPLVRTEIKSSSPVTDGQIPPQPDSSSADKIRSTLVVSEDNFESYIGPLTDFDPKKIKKPERVFYNPGEYLQGYVDSAYKLARSKQQPIELDAGSVKITIFPDKDVVYVNCDDDTLRALCRLPVPSRAANRVSARVVDGKDCFNGNGVSNVHTMEAFLWQVALWSSSCRVPVGVDLERPITLNRWPNSTRCIVTPYALRITAMLAESPCSLIGVANNLQIHLQYVFAYFSAAHALGFVAQDALSSQEMLPTDLLSDRKPTGILHKILNRLRRR